MSQGGEMSAVEVASPYVDGSRAPGPRPRHAHVRTGYEQLRAELADDTRVLAGLRTTCRASDARWLAELEARAVHNAEVLEGLRAVHALAV